MNILEQWRYTEEQKKEMTPAMIERADAVIKFLEDNPDVIESIENWRKLTKEEQNKMTEEYQQIYLNMPENTEEEKLAKTIFFQKNWHIIRP